MQQPVDTQTNALESEKIGRLLLNYSLPAIVGMLSAALYNLVDRIYIGQGVGPLAISGLGLTFPLMILITAFGTLVGVGASARISIVLGMKDAPWARNVLGNALVLSFCFSVLLVTFSMIYLDELLLLFGGSSATIPYAREYLEIVIPGSWLSNLSYSFSGMMRASGFPKKSMYTMLIGIGLNAIVAPVFIFGLDMGIRGAAWATVLSMLVSAIFVLSHFFNTKHQVHFQRNSFRLKWSVMWDILSIGFAPFSMNVAGSGVTALLNHQLVAQGGDLAIGAYSILAAYAMVMIMCIMGLCQGMQPIVGYNYGAGNLKRMKDTFLLTMRIGLVIMGVGFLMGELFPHWLVGVFTSDPELKAMAIPGMRIAFMMFPVVGFEVIVASFFQAINQPLQAVLISLTRQVLFLIPLFYFFSRWFGLTGIWASLPLSDLMAGLLALFFIYRARNKFYPKSLLKA